MSSVYSLLYAILSPLIILLRPIFISSLASFWKRFIAQSWKSIAIQTALSFFFLALAVLEKRYGLFSRSYGACNRKVKQWQDGLRKKSKTAANALPHILFLVIVGAFEYLTWGSIPPALRKVALFAVTRGIPAFYSARILNHHFDLEKRQNLRDASNGDALEDVDSSSVANGVANGSTTGSSSANGNANGYASSSSRSKNDTASSGSSASSNGVRARRTMSLHSSALQSSTRRPRTSFTDDDEDIVAVRKEKALLQYWALISISLAIRQVIHFFLPAMFGRLLFWVDPLVCYFALWLRSSASNGASIAFRAVSYLFGRKLELKDSETKAKVGIILSLMVSIGVLSQNRADVVSTTLSESGVALSGVVFLITPQFVTFLGTVLIGWVAPSYLILSSSRTAPQRRKWLAYFAVFSLADTAVEVMRRPFSWLPIFYHLKVVLILWLQLYNGGFKLFTEARRILPTFTNHRFPNVRRSKSLMLHNKTD